MRKNFFITAGILILTAPFLFWYLPFFNQKYHFQIPTQFSAHGIPLIEIKIQGHEYPLEMDLGSKFQLALYKNILDLLDKTPREPLVCRDIAGRSYETPAYALSSIEVAGMVMDNVVVKEESMDYVFNTIFSENSKKSIEEGLYTAGTLGSALFSDKNLLLDFNNSVFFISNDIQDLITHGYDLKKFVKVPYISSKHFIIVNVETELGMARLVLDTGSTVCFIRSSFASHLVPQGKRSGLPFITTSKFEMSGKDFGPMNLCLYDICSELSEMDGLLGMDFLKNHVIYIDREYKQLYIKKSF